jgi:adenosylmethionine-8-amino-7-oxononanoate aminotransferase
VPGFVHVPTCYPYRQQGMHAGESAGQAAARQLEEAIRREDAGTIAAFVAEPIHGAGGIVYPDDEYWPLVRDVCTRHDVLLIADEIITGIGRTGRWFGLSHWNVTPDIVTFAKGVTSGYVPLGGMMVSRSIKDAMDDVAPEHRWMHAYTYSGHPVSCAVALANLDLIERERLLRNAAAMGVRLKAGLESAMGHLPFVGEVRGGLGLLAAVEFVEDRVSKRNIPASANFATALRLEMMKRGVFTRTRPSQGAHPAAGDVLFFAPPLVVTDVEIDRLVSAACDAAQTVAAAACR